MSRIPPTEAQYEAALRHRLRLARTAAGAKNKDLAASMGVAPGTTSGWCSGSGPLPGPGRLHALALLMGTSLLRLVTETSEDLEIVNEPRSEP